jgi:hypothetical protein
MSQKELECENCGAERAAGLAACPFCKTAYPGVAGAVRCPRCGDANVQGNPVCMSCQAPLSIACVFCNAASPLGTTACVRCGEMFEGAAARKAERDAQARLVQAASMAVQGVAVVEALVDGAGGPSGVLAAVEDLIGRVGGS